MRVDMPAVAQPLIESRQAIEKKELTVDSQNGNREIDESQAFFPAPLGFRNTYSLASLRAAVDYNAKFLTVAESNVQAAQHAPTIPRLILDYFNAR